jgi:hypothetical protein
MEEGGWEQETKETGGMEDGIPEERRNGGFANNLN